MNTQIPRTIEPTTRETLVERAIATHALIEQRRDDENQKHRLENWKNNADYLRAFCQDVLGLPDDELPSMPFLLLNGPYVVTAKDPPPDTLLRIETELMSVILKRPCSHSRAWVAVGGFHDWPDQAAALTYIGERLSMPLPYCNGCDPTVTRATSTCDEQLLLALRAFINGAVGIKEILP